MSTITCATIVSSVTPFDILPHLAAVSSPQSIGVGIDGAASTVTNALSQCGRFFLTRNEVQQIVGEVDEAVSHWRTEFRLAGLSPSEIHMLEPVFAASVESDAIRVAVSAHVEHKTSK